MDGFAFQIDIIALRWGIGIFVFFIIAWIILAKKLLKSEPKAIKVNLADRYEDLLDDNLLEFGIKSEEFKKMVYTNFKNINNAFMEYDYEELKKYLTKDLYDYYFEQLELFKKRRYKNIFKDYELLKIKIYKISNEHNMLVLDVYLNVRMLDYMINVDNGKCIRGKQEQKIDYEFQLSFVKKEGEKFLLSKKECINEMIPMNEEEKEDK